MRLKWLGLAFAAAAAVVDVDSHSVVDVGSLPTTHFLILFVDDLGYADLGFTNGTQSTPHVDKLAQEGMWFKQWYSGSAVCTPSRSALCTGRLPIRSGLGGIGTLGSAMTSGNVGGLPANETTLAEALKPMGYDTKLVGKWHLGQRPQYLPTNHGYDEWIGIPYSVDAGCSWWAFWAPDNSSDAVAGTCEQNEWHWTPLPLFDDMTIVEQPIDLSTLTSRYVASASEYIKRHAAGGSRIGVPFLLQVHFGHVHVPMFCETPECDFGMTVSGMDSDVGAIVDALDASGLGESTLVWFCSDNGPWLLENRDPELGPNASGSAYPFRGGKFDTWEGGFRSAAIARWTNVIEAGSTTDALATTMDIFATALAQADAAGSLAEGYNLDGRDLTPVFTGINGTTPHQCVFFYQGSPSVIDAGNLTYENDWGCDVLFAMRCGDFKVHWFTSTAEPHIKMTKLEVPIIWDFTEEAGQRELDEAQLDPTSATYASALGIVTAQKHAHLAAMVGPNAAGVNQMGMGDYYELAPCADPNSQAKYPGLPNCTITPGAWAPFVADVDARQVN